MTLQTSGQISINDLTEEFGIASQWVALSAGSSNPPTSSAIDNRGVLWAWGENVCGQVGDGTTVRKNSPVSVIGGFTDWQEVSAGHAHNVALRSNGTLWAWGNNDSGQLGIGVITRRSSPVSVVGGFTDWCQASAGWCHTAAIRTNGTLWAWGYGSRGALGNVTTITRSSPVSVVGGFTDWCQVSAGWLRTAAVRTNGTLWTWGFNFCGSLGDGTTIDRSSPVQVAGGITNWCKTKANFYVTAGLTTSGQIYTWGCNRCGMLGLNSGLNRSSPTLMVGTPWSDVCVGSFFVLAKKSSGLLWSWGRNEGLLGDGTTINRSSPVQVLSNKSWNLITADSRPFATDQDNILHSWGCATQDGITDTVGTVTVPKRIDLFKYSGESSMSCFYQGGVNVPCITKNVSIPIAGEIALSDFYGSGTDVSEMYKWGNNTIGQIGDGTTATRDIPTKVTGNIEDWIAIDNSAGITKNGVLWAWGQNTFGRVGDGTTINRSSPVQVLGGFTDWCQVSSGEGTSNTAALRADGTLWAWGTNSGGTVGDGTTINRSSPVQVIGGFTNWCYVDVGSSVIAAIRTDGTLWSWGFGSCGEIGDGTTINRSSPVSVVGGITNWCQVSTSQDVTVAIRTNGTLWAWGRGSDGQSGNNDAITRSSPVQVVGFTNWCQASVGRAFVSAIRTNGTIWSWGFNGQGRLGDGTTVARSSPVIVAGGFTDWCQVAAGEFFAFGLRTNGEVYGWGYNGVNRHLGIGNTIACIVNPTQLTSISDVICIDNKSALSKKRTTTESTVVASAYSWGSNTFGVLGDGTITSRSSPVSIVGEFTDWCQISTFSNNSHVLGLRSNGTLWAWGVNYFGKLGTNSGISRSSPTSVVGGFNDWCQISAGAQNSAAIRTNGTLWTWGCNGQGILGDNSTICRSSPVQVAGGATTWCQVSLGQFHSSAIRNDGTLWTWGGNGGRLADGTTIARSSPVQIVGGITGWCQVSASLAATLAVTTAGRLYGWGDNSIGTLGDNTVVYKSSPVQTASATADWCYVALGQNNAIAIKIDGTLWAWGGSNFNGALGNGTTTSRSSPTQVIGGITNWCQASITTNHAAGVRADGTLWTWGLGSSGQLGNNCPFVSRSSPVQIVGGLAEWVQVSVGLSNTFAVRKLL